MPPKAAEKKPSTGAGKAPAGKAPAEKKEAGKKTAAPSGDKKKRNKTRKETYSSYIYKGLFASFGINGQLVCRKAGWWLIETQLTGVFSFEASAPGYRHFQSGYVYSEFVREWCVMPTPFAHNVR